MTYVRLMASSIRSPYTLSYWGQTKLCLRRGFLRLRADPSLTITQLFGNLLMSLVLGSVFYGQGRSGSRRAGGVSDGLSSRRNHCELPSPRSSAILRYSDQRIRGSSRGERLSLQLILLKLRRSQILTLYAQRPIVEKHTGYAL
jgi:hypothetical protein